MGRKADPDWRNRAAAELLVRYLPALPLASPVLVMEDPLPDVARALKGEGLDVRVWSRRAWGGRPASPWPEPGPVALAFLRLPRAKEELAMSLHAAGSVVRPGGGVVLYGARDEGIQSSEKVLGHLFANVETVGIGGHCRILKGTGQRGSAVLRGSLAAWKSSSSLDYAELGPAWASYPGVFAHGHLDPGSRLLLDSLPSIAPGSRVLDYGCGSGVVGGVVRSRGDRVRVTMLDVDAVALEAAGENVPGATLLLSDGLPQPGREAWDMVVANPPFHRGKREDPSMIVDFIRGAAGLMKPQGALVFVSQRRLPLEESLSRAYRRVSVLAEDAMFRVWEGRHPVAERV